MVPLGKGVLTWTPHERRSDRYGSVWLMNDGHTSLTEGYPEKRLNLEAVKSVVGCKGTLAAVVLDPRDSTHIGDFFRGLFPTKPEKWETVTLGTGTAFTERDDYAGTVFGLKPDDGRDSDWLAPEALYRAHEQMVELQFHPCN